MRYHGNDTVLSTVWACFVACCLIYEVSVGRRWWILPALRKERRDLNITGPKPELAGDTQGDSEAHILSTLLECIYKIWWSSPSASGTFPEFSAMPCVRICGAMRPTHVKEVTSVHPSCKFVVIPVTGFAGIWKLQKPILSVVTKMLTTKSKI